MNTNKHILQRILSRTRIASRQENVVTKQWTVFQRHCSTAFSTPGDATNRRDTSTTTSSSRTNSYQKSGELLSISSSSSPCRNFSSSAAAAAEVTSMRRSGPRAEKKDPIILTERAADRIKELLATPNGRNALGIRLGVKRRGCNGLSYTLNYATERNPHEEEMAAHGVTVFIEPMALFNVVGTVMDYEITDMSSEFTFQNPNSKGECGCGESFNV